MKKTIFTLFPLLFFCLGAMAQFGAIPSRTPLYFGVEGVSKKTVILESLRSAKSISDFVQYYPKNWISSYTSVEVSTILNGKKRKAISKNEALTKEQQSILNSIELSEDLYVFVRYVYKDPVSKQLQTSAIDYSATAVSASLIPSYEAEYAEGYSMLKQYLKEHAINNIPQKIIAKLNYTSIRFTVNESGEISKARISNSSKDITTDKLLLDAINNMPKWKPAKNANGVSIKQEFQFTIGNGGC